MSQQEISDFFESCRRVFTLLFPFLMVGLVTSFVDFLQKHLGKERFKLTKLIVALQADEADSRNDFRHVLSLRRDVHRPRA